jgi:hypothetical protein
MMERDIMHKIRVLNNVLCLLLISILFGCQQSTKVITERAKDTAFKGMELYSWKTDTSVWKYAIMVGTNRNKKLDEVIKNPMSLEEVKINISIMAIGESVFWFNQVESSGRMIILEYPPIEVIHELKQYASLYNVNLITQ